MSGGNVSGAGRVLGVWSVTGQPATLRGVRTSRRSSVRCPHTPPHAVVEASRSARSPARPPRPGRSARLRRRSKRVLAHQRLEVAKRRQGHCQTNWVGSVESTIENFLCCKLPPFGQRSGSGLFEYVAAVEMALVVEMVVDRSMDGGEFLQSSDLPEFGHCAFPSPEGLM